MTSRALSQAVDRSCEGHEPDGLTHRGGVVCSIGVPGSAVERRNNVPLVPAGVRTETAGQAETVSPGVAELASRLNLQKHDGRVTAGLLPTQVRGQGSEGSGVRQKPARPPPPLPKRPS